jgi:hypothetical protein
MFVYPHENRHTHTHTHTHIYYTVDATVDRDTLRRLQLLLSARGLYGRTAIAQDERRIREAKAVGQRGMGALVRFDIGQCIMHMHCS